ncbi:target of rapamycin complex 2 subunit MAPKAP1 isoform X1 [Apis florea]|uniref:Target of rapamycin complex 2 subunit MAPKAP1 isoform X1 n=1 Tax=Apis mellifera TaxID=7460 RepID=A0A7M7GAV8_APIME|nr:target of rapamycin complex 2 subunit MAPKAP1 isoform X1 [Apis mellifera]XP_003698855.1 target of rapamycin complex 2 subunit MAPKAP1 isoform X1 [Apis florea]KAG6801918.1 target of rapamycin complex 2 subunit MAPKAP1 isoform X1 [Apis mellifera caucasica]KAG9433404.1 target of rapamycin complex 2 subunit MAPKAP1 isoform X1 [Apis mellifera carnica]|eukprot:XP_003249202.3 target of rapamycin complex 2 subunit MAPKAP1 isoform X1 [Apis mellifera]
MAFYDNEHWLLSHIRDSFLSTDNTGQCEMVMLGEDIPKQLKSNGMLQCYPGMEESDDEDLDALAESYDIQMDMEYSHRERTNTAQRLEKMDLEREKAAKISVKWKNDSVVPVTQQSELFQRKDFRKKTGQTKRYSLLSEQLEKCPNVPQNPFIEYAKFDGSAQVDIPIRKYRIFMCMLPKKQRTYPLHMIVLATAKVLEFIGLICYKYANEHPDHPLKDDITRYGLYFTEDDGEVDWDLPCLDPKETISKFEFTTLGLAEMKPSDRARHNMFSWVELRSEEDFLEGQNEEQEVAEDLAKMEGHTTAMEAPLYQSYRVYIINKVRTKSEIYLGISGEKIEINPIITGKGAGRFWNRQRAVSYQIDNIAWCEITETKGSKTTFTLVYTPRSSTSDILVSSGQMQSLHQSASFKNHEFEADSMTAEEIVRKINHILELHNSTSRKEYLSQKERKATRRKSFHLHR